MRPEARQRFRGDRDDPRDDPREKGPVVAAASPATRKPAAVRSPLLIIMASPALTFVFLVSILMNAGLSVVVPSLALQLESMDASPTLLGYIAAASPLVSVVSPTLTGLIADRCASRLRTPYAAVFLVTFLCFVGGNVMQSLATGPAGLGAARLLIGCSTGCSSVGIAHIMRELKDPSERTRVVAIYSGVEMVGYITGTALGGAMATVRGNVLGVELNCFNAPTLASAAAAMLLLTLGLPGFARREAALKGEPFGEKAGGSDDDNGGGKSGDDDREPPPPPPTTPPSPGLSDRLSDSTHSALSPPSDPRHGGLGLSGGKASSSSSSAGALAYDPRVAQALVILLYCLVAAMYNALETVSTPLTVKQFGWGVRENAFLWTGSGLVGTLASLFVGHLPPNYARPPELLAASLCATILGPALMHASLRRSGPSSRFAMLPLASRGGGFGRVFGGSSPSGGVFGTGGGTSSGFGVPGPPVMEPLFLVGFFIFDVGYVITESVLVVLFANAVDPTVAADDVEEEGEHAFLFGIFNSIGWFLGCALGAIAGNHLFLISPGTMLGACSLSAVSVALALVLCRRRVFSETDLRAVDPAATPAAVLRLPRRAAEALGTAVATAAATLRAKLGRVPPLSSTLPSSSSSSSSSSSASAASSSSAGAPAAPMSTTKPSASASAL